MTDKFNPRDMAQLDALMELANKATEGPWIAKRQKCFCGSCEAGDVWRTDSFHGECTVCKDVAEYHDLPFIAASREAVPALIEEVKRLRNALTRVQSGEGFTGSWIADNNKEWGELIAVKDFAREALQAEGV